MVFVGNAQSSDLFRVEYLHIPNDNTGNSIGRFRTFFQLPLEFKKNNYIVVGGEYRNINLDLKDFYGKPVFIVNTASKCGFTPQYGELQKLYKEFENDGVIFIGVPSNDFRQELNTNELINLLLSSTRWLIKPLSISFLFIIFFFFNRFCFF